MPQEERHSHIAVYTAVLADRTCIDATAEDLAVLADVSRTRDPREGRKVRAAPNHDMACARVQYDERIHGGAILDHHGVSSNPLAQALGSVRQSRCQYARIVCQLFRQMGNKLPRRCEPLPLQRCLTGTRTDERVHLEKSVLQRSGLEWHRQPDCSNPAIDAPDFGVARSRVESNDTSRVGHDGAGRQRYVNRHRADSEFAES